MPITHAVAACRRAFTLIELMIAVALSTVIVLTAVAAFRVASRAIALANGLSNENALLRLGYHASMEDVDFYHSEANDRAPYLKGFTRLKTKVADDPSTPEDDSRARRHFQAVRFMPQTDPAALPYDDADPTHTGYVEAWNRVLNPNVMLAHDARSIDRSHIFANRSPDQYQYRYATPLVVHGDYRLVACTDMRFRSDQPNPRFPRGLPASYGLDRDYVTVPAWPDPTGVPSPDLTASINAPVDTTFNQAIPLLAWQVYSRLSVIGLTEYLPSGINLFIQDQNGQIPNALWTDPTPQPFTSPKGFPDRNMSLMGSVFALDYAYGMNDISSFFGQDFRPFFTFAVGIMPVLGAPPGMNTSTTWYDHSPEIISMIGESREAGFLGGYGWYRSQPTTRMQSGDTARNDTQYTSRTVRLPYNRVDGERAVLAAAWTPDETGRMTPHYQQLPLDYSSKASRDPTLTTTIMRYRHLGGAGAVTIVTAAIEDPVTGKRVELSWVPYGTTYRGARQHWRLFSPAYANANAVGDFYDDAAGPFYAP